ncbi:flagellar biosynthetic protein FliR [Sphingosinicella terrae]|uniref:flagellar biosynthetic protein FliR n=1 Tax=Sphingosinicella terrae TaxID=2172047 RepID=UPI000E0D6EA0|nr:flagellar biosynthetic protein FliR [Sphingosinicella terrae]
MQDLPLHATGFLILFARVGAVLMLLPVFSDEAVPGRIRLLIAFAMTAGMWGLLDQNVLPAARDEAGLAGTIVVELVIGLAIGTVVRMMFLAIVMAGSIVSLQVGLSSALIFDASMGGQAPILAKLIAVAAAVLCMSLGLHHLWIGAIIRSYDLFPVGAAPLAGDLAALGVATISRSMALAVSLSAPLLVYGIVFNVALGFSSRLAPSIQVFFIAQPLNLLFGLGLFATVVGTMLAAFAGAMTDWMQGGWS